MSYARLHIVIKVLALVAIVFYSTGATVVVKYCTMSESAECCCNGERAASKAAPSTVATQVAPCFSVHVVGGLDETRGTTGQSELVKDVVRSVLSFAAPVIVDPPASSFQSRIPPVDPSPPQPDICLTGCTLLI